MESTGTGDLILEETSLQGFLNLPPGKVFYTVQTLDHLNWESGIGEVAEITFHRLVVLSNSNNDTDLVDFPDIQLDIFVSAPVHGVFDQLNHLSLTDRPTHLIQHDYYGLGVDGDITLTENTTLTRPLFPKNLIVDDITLTANEFQIIASESIQIINGGIITASGLGGPANTPLAQGGGGVGFGGSITNRFVPPVDCAFLGNVSGGGSGSVDGPGGGWFVLAAPLIRNDGQILAQGANGGGGGLIYLITDRYIGPWPDVQSTGDTLGEDGKIVMFNPASRQQYPK